MLLTLVTAVAALADPAPAPPPPGASVDTMRRRVDTILTELERRGDGLKDIRCKVRYVEDDRLNLTRREKEGTILLQMAEPNPRILIYFDRTKVDDVRPKKQKQWYLFDGAWAYSAIERVGQVTKQQVARPGERINLFDIENSPFPLPFGHKKEDIRGSFDVALVAPAKGDPPGADHLVCIPKADSRVARKYKKVEFFILRDVHLPVRVVVTKNGFETNTADFPDLSAKSINTGVRASDFAQPRAWRGYGWVIQPIESDRDAERRSAP
ncbi:MAG: hypothetical protein ACE5E6_01455 [Phycisphaerae bacterium]